MSKGGGESSQVASPCLLGFSSLARDKYKLSQVEPSQTRVLILVKFESCEYGLYELTEHK